MHITVIGHLQINYPEMICRVTVILDDSCYHCSVLFSYRFRYNISGFVESLPSGPFSLITACVGLPGHGGQVGFQNICNHNEGGGDLIALTSHFFYFLSGPCWHLPVTSRGLNNQVFLHKFVLVLFISQNYSIKHLGLKRYMYLSPETQKVKTFRSAKYHAQKLSGRSA